MYKILARSKRGVIQEIDTAQTFAELRQLLPLYQAHMGPNWAVYCKRCA